jgi:hypothetical protein
LVAALVAEADVVGALVAAAFRAGPVPAAPLVVVDARFVAGFAAVAFFAGAAAAFLAGAVDPAARPAGFAAAFAVDLGAALAEAVALALVAVFAGVFAGDLMAVLGAALAAVLVGGAAAFFGVVPLAPRGDAPRAEVPVLLAMAANPFEVLIRRRRGRVRAG